jgi:hypothetical protein
VLQELNFKDLCKDGDNNGEVLFKVISGGDDVLEAVKHFMTLAIGDGNAK